MMASGCAASKKHPWARLDYNFEGGKVRMVMTPKGPMRPAQAEWVRDALARVEIASMVHGRRGEAEKGRRGSVSRRRSVKPF
jgi:hypothetical protein